MLTSKKYRQCRRCRTMLCWYCINVVYIAMLTILKKEYMYVLDMEDVRLLTWYFSCSSQNKSKTPLSCTDLAGMGGIKRCPLEDLDLLQKFIVKLPKVKLVLSLLQHNKRFLSPTLPPYPRLPGKHIFICPFLFVHTCRYYDVMLRHPSRHIIFFCNIKSKSIHVLYILIKELIFIKKERTKHRFTKL